MKTKPRVVLIGLTIVLALCDLGCASTLTGQVVSSSTGEGIGGATIELAGMTAVTGYDGRFTIEGLKGGELTGTVSLEGFEPQEFTVDLRQGAAPLVVEIPDCMLVVSVVEKAIEPVEVTDMIVTLDDLSHLKSPSTFERLAPGDHILKVKSEGHEPYESTITLAAGESALAVELSLTPQETYRRYLGASLYSRSEVKYAYIHPDEQALLTLERYLKLDQGTQLKSYSIGDVLMRASWTSEWTGKTYTDVAEIDRTITYEVVDPKRPDYGQEYTGHFSQHWVKVDGIWRLIYPEEL